MHGAKKITIGVDIRSLLSQPVTGVGVYVSRMVEALSSLEKSENFSLKFITAGSKKVIPIRDKVVGHLSVPSRHVPISNKLANALMSFTSLAPFDRIMTDLDALWLPNINFFQTKLSFPLIVTIHDLSFLHNPEYYSFTMRVWHSQLHLERLLRRSSVIVAVSENTKGDILKFFPFVKKDSIHVIYPGPTAVSTSSEILQSTREKYKLPHRFILYVGTLEPRKNLVALLEAFNSISSQYPDIPLVLAGSPGWRSRSIQRQIKQMHNVRWLSYVTDEDKNALYELATIFVWPSYYEGYGFPPLESIDHGTPVVASFRTALPEILRTNAHYVNPYNSGEIAKVISSMLVSRPTPQKDLLSAANDWQSAARKLLSLIQQSYANRN